MNKFLRPVLSETLGSLGTVATVVKAGFLMVSLATAATVLAQQPAPTDSQHKLNDVAQAAAQMGASSCVQRINEVTSFLGFGAQSGAVMMVPPNAQDQRLIPLAMEIPTEAGSAYVSAHFAPHQINGCGAAYDAIVYWPQNCDIVADRQFPALKKIGKLKKDLTILDGGTATKVFLMPAGSGCVSIKKEVVL